MRRVITTIFAAIMMLAVNCALPGLSLAFHSGGAGECEGCHVIHNSDDGRPIIGQAGKYLLKGGDSSSVCLNCHQKNGDTGPTTYHISTADTDMPAGSPPRQLTPGGDFGWLKKTYIWNTALSAQPLSSNGDRHGHNIVAADYGYYADSYKLSAPGGTYPSSSMGCTSCHDPHGKYRRNLDGSITTGGKPIFDSGSYNSSRTPDSVGAVGAYRLLGGSGYKPVSLVAGLAFTSNPPAAVAPDSYNRSESATQTRVAYGTGMSDWCRNCHPNIHTDTVPATVKHPAGGSSGQFPPEYRAYYSSYVKTGDLSGTEETAYLSLAPFEVGTGNYDTLKGIVNITPNKGPSSLDGAPGVMCLSCHRAHASGWDGAMRWNNGTAAIIHNGKYSQEGQPYQPYGQGRTEAEARRAYYDMPVSKFSSEQSPLCYKCHVTGTK